MSRYAAIRLAMRLAIRQGFNPYDSLPAQAKASARFAGLVR